MTTLPTLLVLAALGLAGLSLFRGPALGDRVVALDMIATLAVGLIALHAVALDETAFLDAALVLAAVAFVGTLAFAHYIEHSGEER